MATAASQIRFKLLALWIQRRVFLGAKFRQNAKHKYKKGVFYCNILLFLKEITKPWGRGMVDYCKTFATFGF
jgi:hypothetical protein